MSNILDDQSSEIISFVVGCIKIYQNYVDRMGYKHNTDTFHTKQGKRYIKVVRGGSVHCFVDRTNGDVLKAASWKAPAKHARGNVFDKDNGLGSMGEYGPAYLR